MGKIVSQDDLIQAIAREKDHGRCVVFTNGCFDLLHFGHVSYLQRARKLGDLLVVGLNGDRSVTELKGLGRPLVPQRQRAAVLAALACVDAVVIFPQKRAHRFLATMQPDIYVKGGTIGLRRWIPASAPSSLPSVPRFASCRS